MTTKNDITKIVSKKLIKVSIAGGTLSYLCLNAQIYNETDIMATKDIGEKYRCNICGNEVEVTKVGGGTLVCCGEDMELLK